jgi:hypothetical protein
MKYVAHSDISAWKSPGGQGVFIPVGDPVLDCQKVSRWGRLRIKLTRLKTRRSRKARISRAITTLKQLT